jgi:hypothetical protein
MVIHFGFNEGSSTGSDSRSVLISWRDDGKQGLDSGDVFSLTLPDWLTLAAEAKEFGERVVTYNGAFWAPLFYVEVITMLHSIKGESRWVVSMLGATHTHLLTLLASRTCCPDRDWGYLADRGKHNCTDALEELLSHLHNLEKDVTLNNDLNMLAYDFEPEKGTVNPNE